MHLPACRARHGKCRLLRLLESRRQRDVSVQQAKDHLHGCTHVVPSADENGTALRGMHKPQKLRQSSGAEDKTYLSIKCNPDAVSITGEISPGFRANDASSNSFCMSPCPKNPLMLARQRLRQDTRAPCVIPRREKSGTRQCRETETYRSPRLRAELQSDSVVARSPRLVEPDLILLS